MASRNETTEWGLNFNDVIAMFTYLNDGIRILNIPIEILANTLDKHDYICSNTRPKETYPFTYGLSIYVESCQIF